MRSNFFIIKNQQKNMSISQEYRKAGLLTLISYFSRTIFLYTSPKRFNLAFSMADRLSRVAERHPYLGLLSYGQECTLRSKLAFTMAEILISLTIIGVIAAITLPSLRANINEKTWTTQKKALYSRMSQAISMLPSLNGYGIVMNENGTVNETETASKAAQAFITDGLSKVLKINNICDSTNLKDCGIPSKITTMDNSKKDFPLKVVDLNPGFAGTYAGLTVSVSIKDSSVAAFLTSNGESVGVFYNPNCIYTRNSMQTAPYYNYVPYICANFIYDLNGIKGPNKIGKDIGFITAFYPTSSEIVAPMPFDKDLKDVYQQSMAIKQCGKNGGRLPNIYEISSMAYNLPLIGLNGSIYWSTTSQYNDNTRAWRLNGYDYGTFLLGTQTKTAGYKVRCIKR